MKDIYKYCERDLDYFQKQYNRGDVDGNPATCNTYSLKVIGEYREEIDDVESECVYYKEIENGKTTRENKYWEEEDKTINAPFNVFIIVGLYCCPEMEEAEGGNVVMHKSVKEDECVVCYENEPNVLYYDCRHIATCDKCESIGNITRCPICRTDVKNGKIQL